MKKIAITATLVVFMLFLVFPQSASADVDRVGDGDSIWDTIGSYVLSFLCTSGCSGTYEHEMEITSMDQETGDFEGDGSYIVNPLYTWDLMGNLVDSAFGFVITYTGLAAGYEIQVEGVIAEDGTLSGTAASSMGQEFEFESIEGAATEVEIEAENHGQYVKSQEDKREAAQEREGMPVQSKGFTK